MISKEFNDKSIVFNDFFAHQVKSMNVLQFLANILYNMGKQCFFIKVVKSNTSRPPSHVKQRSGSARAVLGPFGPLGLLGQAARAVLGHRSGTLGRTEGSMLCML